MRNILNQKENMNKDKYEENPEPKREYEKNKYEENHIFTAELYCLVGSFDDKTYLCGTCHKQLSRNDMLCQAVFNKMILDRIPDELKN